MWLGRLARPTLGRLILLVLRVRVIGSERVPKTGAILAGNHVSYVDPVVLWCASPRPVHFMAKREIFQGFVGWVSRRVWAFPVTRGQADRTAIQTASGLLEAGELVGIFPEGTRHSGEGLGEAQGGVAFIAIRANAPIVPVAIVGTERVWPRGAKLPRLARVTIKYGEPIDPGSFAGVSRREQVDAVTAELMTRISAELGSARESHDAR